MPNPINPTTNTWNQIANKQAYTDTTIANLNSNTIITRYDPIFNKLIERISRDIYRRLEYAQRWNNIGTNAGVNEYPGILREIAMRRRRGQNFPADNGTRPTTLNCYDIYNDVIEVRYHDCQVRWMYPFTIWDEELRRFSGGNGATIAQVAEMTTLGAMSARNMFMDSFRKQVLYLYMTSVAGEFNTGIDISDFTNLTTDQAKEWLIMIDELCYQLEIGSALYNGLGEYIQTPRSNLQLIMPYNYYMNVTRKAFPDTYNKEFFENLLPDNLILIDTLGGDKLTTDGTTEVTYTWNTQGMNTTPWTETNVWAAGDPNIQAIIMDKGAIGFETNYEAMLMAPKDIEKLATAGRHHFWARGYVTDMVNGVAITKGE